MKLANRAVAVAAAAIMLAGGLICCTPASAETITLKAELKGANEVPPNDSTAPGTAEATLDTATKALSWVVTYADLSGPAIGAHFHGPGEPGKISGIVLPFRSA